MAGPTERIAATTWTCCGVADADVRHAVRNAVRRIAMDEDLTMLIGPESTGRSSRSGFSAWKERRIDDLGAVAVAAERVRADEERLREAVEAARAHGRSWNQVAVALGVSRQAARQRFSDKVHA